MARNAPKGQQQANGQRAAIYARVSDKSQDTEDKTSISEQISDMEAHCERRGLTITARYQEVGRGWSKNRPEFQRMLADAKKGRFDTIVCCKSDRLSRGMYPAAALMEVIEAYQIELEAVMDAIDMKTFGLMAAIGKIELDNFRERASMGKRGSAKQGRIPVNNVPFGYRLGEGRRPLVEEIAKAERDLQKVQVEEDRAIRLYVSGKITEKQLDHQRRFITERLETLREQLNEYRDRESAQSEQRDLAERVMQWAEWIGDGLDELPQEERREVLRLLLDGATIDKHNQVKLTLSIPTEDFLSIAGPEPITACTR